MRRFWRRRTLHERSRLDVSSYVEVAVLFRDRGARYCFNKRSSFSTMEGKSQPRVIIRSMLLRLAWQWKQWARLFRGLTYASISPQ